MIKLLRGVVLPLLLLCVSTTQADTQALTDITELQRKTIFLLSLQADNDVAEEQNVHIARNYYYRKQELLNAYEEVILSASSDKSGRYIRDLIGYTHSEKIRAADLLAFIDIVANLLGTHAETPFLNRNFLSALRKLEQQMALVQNTYKENLSDLYAAMGTRGVLLEPWDDYLAFLQQSHHVEDIYREFNQRGSDLGDAESRGKKKKKKDSSLMWGYGLPQKTVVLTFDDGPHHRNTGAILDTLKEHDAKAYFFAVGKNIGTLKGKSIKLHKKSKQLKRALAEGHVLANHSFNHKVLTKLNKVQQQAELKNTNTLLSSITGSDIVDFRPPYGAKNDALVKLSKAGGMRSVMWNIDSKDWGDPIPESIVKRTMKELKKQKRGILLFHDIHKQTVQALPLLLKQLKKEGYKIVTLEGKTFTPEAKSANSAKETIKEPSVKAPKAVVKSQLYGKSWALIIGVNKYKFWPQLSYAVNDAQGVAKVLNEQYGFAEENIITLFDQDATRENITEQLADTLSDPNKVKENDRVFIFYAGHGMTRTLPSGRNLGYIVPVDAQLNKFHSKSISMTHLQDFSEMIPAKHVYFVMDSCYSGIALTRGGGMQAGSKYLNEISSRQARQILTAGGSDQEVADGGPDGHSIFTWSLLQALSGKADLDNNKIITASEIGAYVSPQVAENSNQTPAFGNLVGSEGGEFIFELEVIAGEEASEEERLRNRIATLEKENVALKQQVAQLSLGGSSASPLVASRGQVNTTELTYAKRVLKANNLHAQGLKAYKQKNYPEALSLVHQALQFNPASASIVNDYGFILYRDGQFETALHWLEKSIELDPERRPVYLNIADALVELERNEEAIPYYQHYLQVYPDSPLKERVQMFLASQE